MKVTFNIELIGKPDSNGDVIMPGAIKIPDKVPVFREFKHEIPLAFAEVKIEGEEVKATAEIPDELMDAYPAIGFQSLESEVVGGIRRHTSIKLYSVGLCAQPNVNPDIKTIREQTNGQ